MSIIKVENLTFSYPSNYDTIFDHVNFQIDTDWKLGFIGRNGRGKTTLLNLLLGKYEYGGKIISAVQFDYFPYPISNNHRMTGDILQEICPLHYERAQENLSVQMERFSVIKGEAIYARRITYRSVETY